MKVKSTLFVSIISIAIGGLFFLLSSCGCMDSNDMDEKAFKTKKGLPIFFIQTEAYKKKSSTFSKSADEARKLAEKSLNDPAIGEHYLIVGDEYLFSMKHKMGVHLHGVYVNGNTGKVTERDSFEIIEWKDHPDWLDLLKKKK